ncbi:MAG: phosphoesterase, PA-phosphatase related [Frankiales bacterium]|nr:phosphoesterase, PA-phosphatase related [Frankiales bacterium]
MITALARLDGLDRRLFHAAAQRESAAFDRVLPRLTHSADHGLLWYGVACLLALTGRRRAAVRGLASLLVASSLANIPAKLATRRQRPQLHPVPLPRQLRRQPTSTSFPSGHSTSAAAFTVGVALEQPVLAAPVGLLAAGVAYGRVHTGVHYPGDVVAGLALGAACAVAVKRVWPAKPDRPAAGRPAVDAPSLPDGEGLVVVLNEGGGSADQRDEVEKTLAELLPRAELVRASDDIEQVLRTAAGRAQVLGAMGGDGTISLAAGIALEAGLPLVVLPGGTLNHFAAELGIAGVADIVEAVRTGSAVQVSVGSAAPEGEGLYFLNTFALGVYPELVKEREKHEQRLGKWPAMALATVRMLRKAERVTVTVNGVERELWTLFAGNGHYHPAGFAPSWRERMDDGCIDVRLVDAAQRFSRTRLTLAVLTGLLGRSQVYEERVVGRMHVSSRAPLRIARDGEVSDGPSSLLLRAAASPLVVYRP